MRCEFVNEAILSRLLSIVIDSVCVVVSKRKYEVCDRSSPAVEVYLRTELKEPALFGYEECD